MSAQGVRLAAVAAFIVVSGCGGSSGSGGPGPDPESEPPVPRPPLPSYVKRVGPEFEVSTGTRTIDLSPVLVARPDGAFTAAWTRWLRAPLSGIVESGSSTGLASFGADGKLLGPLRSIASDFSADIAATPNGGFVVVWGDTNATDPTKFGEIYGRRFDADDMPVGSAIQINRHTTTHQSRPALGVAGDGSFVVAWESDRNAYTSTDTTSVWARRFDSGGAALGDDFQINAYTSGQQFAPDVAVLEQGGFAVTWHGRVRNARIFDAEGAPLTGDLMLSESLQPIRADVVTLPGEGFLMSWPSDGSGIGTRRFAASGDPIGREVHFGEYYSYKPTVKVLSLDRLLLVTSHRRPESRDESTFARLLDWSGQPVGPEFQVPRATTGRQHSASLAVTGEDTFVVVWQADNLRNEINRPIMSDEDSDVFAQRFKLDLAVAP